MNDLISKRAVLAKINLWANGELSTDKLIESIKKMSGSYSMGHWIERIERDDWDDYEEVWYECDQCHTDWGGPVNFCPNCGARMVEPKEGSGEE